MKREAGILFAGGIGLLAALSFIGIKKILEKKQKKYNDYYGDYHRHHDRVDAEDEHGVEYFAMK